jgi:hypothetical protein
MHILLFYKSYAGRQNKIVLHQFLIMI